MNKIFTESGNEFILSLMAIVAVTVLAALKIISGDLAVGVIAGAAGMKFVGGGGKKTLAGLMIIVAGAGFLGCTAPVPVAVSITSDPAVCGKKAVYGGAPDDGVHQVARIETQKNNICSGALIASNMIITAKHCGVPKIIDVWGGKYYPERVINHSDADISVIVISDHATYLLGRQIDPLIVYAGDIKVAEKLHIVGYGRRTNGNPPQYPTGGDNEITEINDEYIYFSGEPGVCEGDSGGPAMWGNCIAGVNYGFIGRCGVISVITRLSKYAEWLRSIR